MQNNSNFRAGRQLNEASVGWDFSVRIWAAKSWFNDGHGKYHANNVWAWTDYKWTVYDLSFFDHDDRHRHLAVRILMTTSKWLDNDDYVIM